MDGTSGDGTTARARDLVVLAVLALVFVVIALSARAPSGRALFVAASFAAGGLVLWYWRYGRIGPWGVFAFAVVLRLFFCWLPPTLSDDAYRYVWDGLVQEEGHNPYLLTPDDEALQPLQSGDLYQNLNSKDHYTVYPPVSQLVFLMGGMWYRHGWIVSYYIIKALFVLSELVALVLLVQMVPARRLLLYAWNPLVVIEVAGQAHTEALLVLFLVLTVWLIRKKAPALASAALAGAAWVKLYPLVLFPFLWRRYGWKTIWPAAVVSVILWIPYAHPAVTHNVGESLDLYVRLFEFNAGLYYLVKKIFLLATGDDWSKWLGPVMRGVFLAGLVVCYGVDWRRRWPVARAFVVAVGAYFVLATTVHPWYLLAVLPLLVLTPHAGWHWHWLAVCSLGTYLLYTGGPYWVWVVVGWVGWAVLAAAAHYRPALDGVQWLRARRKMDLIEPWIPSGDGRPILDLGAGEGYVGAHIARRRGTPVQLADVLPMNRTDLPFTLYDGRHLPFGDGAFAATVLYFVLHHCEDPAAVFGEAVRVTEGPIVVVESTYEGRWDRWLLTALDKMANRLRSGGLMRAQEEHLHFRTVDAWTAFFRAHGCRVVAQRRRGRLIHKQAFFQLTRRRPSGDARDPAR